MYQKLLWLLATLLLLGLGFWLGLVIPDQAWAQWDGERWLIVAESWAVLWRGWPLAVFGGLLGFFGAGTFLAFTLQHAQAADFKAHIAKLTRQRDQAVAAAEQRVQAREQAAQHRETLAFTAQRDAEVAQQEAETARQTAEQTRQQAEQAITQANYRVRNAIGAAERIKRRIEGKKRLGAGKSVP